MRPDLQADLAALQQYGATDEDFAADMAALAAMAEAESFLVEIASAMFPDGDVSFERLTWADVTAAAVPATSEADAITRLKEAESRFRTLVEQIPAVTFMAVLGEGKNEVYVSPHIEQMLGYTQQQWLEDPFLWYWRLHPDDRPLWNEEFARGCRSGGPFRAECRFLAKDGRTVWVHGEARVVRDELGRPNYLQGVAFDITEAKRAEQMLLERAVRKAREQEEIAIARRVQESLLPKRLHLPGYEISAAMTAAEDVGGDYYDLLPTPDGNGWLAIGDVTGHGIDAGLLMLMTQSAVQSIVRMQPYCAPHQLVEALNDVLYENIRNRLGQTDHLTFTAFRFTHGGQVVFAGAHEDVIVRRARTGTFEQIRTAGVWLGAKRRIGAVTTDTMLQLHEGDLLVLYTDGITELRDAGGHMLDPSGLCRLVDDVADRSTDAIRDHVMTAARAFATAQHDDMTLVIVRRLAQRPTPAGAA